MAGRFPFSTLPAGWYRVAGSADLGSGQVKSLRCFGKDLVLFRARSGSVSLLDAFCPHMGAHFGLGSVQGDNLRCVFHGWLFDRRGICTALPGDRRVPPRARVRSWPTCEKNGQIMAFYHPLGEAPSWQVPTLPEAVDSEWTGLRRGPRWRLRTHPQEMLENGMDLAHFPVLHHKQTRAAESLGLTADGPFLVHRTLQHYNVFRLARLLSGDVVGPLDLHLYGLGMAVNRAVVHARIQLSYTLAFFLTPIEEDLVDVIAYFAVRKVPSRAATFLLLKKAMLEARRTIGEDTPVWETKAYLTRPALAEGDGRIMPYRRWARQFYVGEGVEHDMVSTTRASVDEPAFAQED